MPADLSIRVLNYAHLVAPAEFCGGVPIHSNQGFTKLSMNYILISEQDDQDKVHHYLVDIGFDRHWIPAWGGFTDWEPPDAVLAKVGIKPEDIEKIFVSHMHFDHVNAISYLPNAEAFVQWAEFEMWAKACTMAKRHWPQGSQSWLMSPFDRNDLAVFAKLAADHKLHFMTDGDQPHPGITGHLSTGHTSGIQWFTVPTYKGDIVVATDCAMWYSNIEERWPAGYLNGDAFEALKTFDAVSEYVGGDLDRVLPGHDMKVFDRHPSYTVNNNEIAEVAIASWDRSFIPAAAVTTLV